MCADPVEVSDQLLESVALLVLVGEALQREDDDVRGGASGVEERAKVVEDGLCKRWVRGESAGVGNNTSSAHHRHGMDMDMDMASLTCAHMRTRTHASMP